MAVALAASYNTNSASNAQNQTITSASFTPTTGDLVIVKIVTEDTATPAGTPSATAGGITWVKRTENKITSTCYAAIWTGTITAGGTAMTISVTTSNSIAGYVSMVIERWTGAQLASSPSICYANATGTPTASMTVVGTGSVISWLNGDWAAISGTASYTGGATQDGYHAPGAGSYTAYYAYQTGSAGSNTIGISAPTGQTYTIMGIEIQVSGQTNPNSGTMMTMGVGI